MFKFYRLSELRSRSHHERQVIAFSVALVLTLIIATIWLVTLFKPIKTVLTPAVTAVTEVKSDSLGLGQTLATEWARVETGWQVIKTYFLK